MRRGHGVAADRGAERMARGGQGLPRHRTPGPLGEVDRVVRGRGVLGLRHRVHQEGLGQGLDRPDLAGRVPAADRPADLLRGVHLPRRAAGQRDRLGAGRRGPASRRHRGAETEVPARHPAHRRALGRGLHRAGGRLGPGLAEHPGGPRRGRVGDQRAEDVHHLGQPRGHALLRGAHRPRGPPAPRHHHLRAAHRPARGQLRPAVQHRRRPAEPHLPGGCPRPAREHDRHRGPRLGPDHGRVLRRQHRRRLHGRPAEAGQDGGVLQDRPAQRQAAHRRRGGPRPAGRDGPARAGRTPADLRVPVQHPGPAAARVRRRDRHRGQQGVDDPVRRTHQPDRGPGGPAGRRVPLGPGRRCQRRPGGLVPDLDPQPRGRYPAGQADGAGHPRPRAPEVGGFAMDIDLEQHQLDLADTARRFFEARATIGAVRGWETSERGFGAELWAEMADLGWLRLGHPESAGGFGGGALELSVIYQAMGRALAPVPHLESAVIGAGVLAAAETPAARDLLEPVLAGTAIVTPALAEDDTGFGPSSIAMAGTVEPDGALRLDGSKILVGYANSASHLIVAARTAPPAAATSGITLALVDVAAPGVALTKLPNLAGYPLYAATFDGHRVAPEAVLGPVHAGWELLEPVLDRAAVLRAAQIQGAAERLLELSVDYAEHRTQFGQAIGRYQAVQYLCSDIAINSHLTSLMVRYAAGLLDAGLPAGKAVSEAKAQASLTARLAPERAHAVHAGIAFILDFDVQLFTRRCRHWELDVGDERYHRERIAAALAA